MGKYDEGGLIKRTKKRGAHRSRRERSALPGMMIHQDGSTHEWVANQKWNSIVTMDDATNEHYSFFFVEEKGPASSPEALKKSLRNMGYFLFFHSDRGSHYWHTPEAGGKVDKNNLIQFGQVITDVPYLDGMGSASNIMIFLIFMKKVVVSFVST